MKFIRNNALVDYLQTHKLHTGEQHDKSMQYKYKIVLKMERSELVCEMKIFDKKNHRV